MKPLHPELATLLVTITDHLVAQGARSKDPATNQCTYRGAEGAKCAVGVLIPDELYHPGIEMGIVRMFNESRDNTRAVVNHLKGLAPNVEEDELVAFLLATQTFHDNDANRVGFSRDAVEAGLKVRIEDYMR